MAAVEPDLYSIVQALLRRTRNATLRDVEATLEKGISPDIWRGPLSPVRYAVQVRHTRLLDLLLRKNANVNLKDARDVTPLHIATFEGKPDCIRILLRARADVNATDRHGQTPLFFAPSKQVCDLLLAARADANATNIKQQTPLHMAAHAGLADALLCIADVTDKKITDLKDHRGHTPLHYAAHSRIKSMAQATLRLQRPPSSRGSARKRPEQLSPVAEIQVCAHADGVAEGPAAGEEDTDTGGGALAVPALTGGACAATPERTCAESSPSTAPQEHEEAVDQETLAAIKRGQWFSTWRNGRGNQALRERQETSEVSRRNTMQPVPQSLPSELGGADLWAMTQPAVETSEGCRHWEVALAKKSNGDKYGFVQADGRADFETRLRLGFVTIDAERGWQGEEGGEMQHSPLPGPEVLIVRVVHEGGLMWAWNRVHEEAAIRPQDRVASVNGQRTVEAMQKEFRASDMVVMKMMRYPERFIVILSRDTPGTRLGIRFERPAQSCQRGQLRIVEIIEAGLLADHNKLQVDLRNWHYVVLPDMLVETANDVTGDATAIAEELKRNRKRVVLTIRRAEHAMFLSQ